MTTAHMKLSCPIDEYGIRRHYLKEIAKKSSNINKWDDRLYAQSLEKNPMLVHNLRYRATRRTKPDMRIKMIQNGHVLPHPLHRNDPAMRDLWVNIILNRL